MIKMPKVTVPIDDDSWDIVHEPLHKLSGLCVFDTQVMHINPRLRGKALLDTYIHEWLHAYMNTGDEDIVAPMATQLAEALWLLGYRLNRKTVR